MKLRHFASLAAAMLLAMPAIASVVQGGENPGCPQFSAFGHPKALDPKLVRRAFHLCKGAYSSYFDPATKTPLWVAERITADSAGGSEERTNDFRPDPEIPAPAQASRSDYARSGYDQGHMAPAADFRDDRAAMSESFLYSNIVPQDPENNQVAWQKLEMLARTYAKSRGEIFVVTGPLFLATGAPVGSVGRSRVAVPTHIFKVLLDPKTGESTAFVLPNAPVSIAGPGARPTLGDWERELARYQTSVREVEKASGFDFNPQLNAVDAQAVESVPRWTFGPQRRRR